jgi:transposase
MASLTLGIDVACRAAHQATLTEGGVPVWKGRKFFTRPADLERLWTDLDLADPAELTVVVEPTRNAWIVLARWFKNRGARVVMVPTTQSAALRDYLNRHTKNDQLDSAMLARLPIMHPEGLQEFLGDGPADPLRRMTRQRASMVQRRTAVFSRIDAQLELLGPAWHAALGSDFGVTALAFLTRYANPEQLLRLGPARLTRFLHSRSRGQWATEKAEALLAAARESIQLWGADGFDYAALAAEIAAEAEQAIFLSEQIKELDQRIEAAYRSADPDQVIASAPGVGPVCAGVFAGRLGDPHRFTSLAAVRCYAGLIPRTNQSGTHNPDLALTKAGDPLLRQMACIAADHARKIDPQLAAKYQRLITAGRHHDSAICHLAASLLTRIVACWKTGQPYQLRDVDGRPITEAEGRRIVAERAAAQPKPKRKRTGRESQKSPGAPTSRPATTTINNRKVA